MRETTLFSSYEAMFGRASAPEIFGTFKIGNMAQKRDEVRGDWGKLHNEELHNLYFSKSVIRVSKSRRMKLAWHVARMGRRGMHVRYWWESQKTYVGGWAISNWILDR
jgi:hypothetical protein